MDSGHATLADLESRPLRIENGFIYIFCKFKRSWILTDSCHAIHTLTLNLERENKILQLNVHFRCFLSLTWALWRKMFGRDHCWWIFPEHRHHHLKAFKSLNLNSFYMVEIIIDVTIIVFIPLGRFVGSHIGSRGAVPSLRNRAQHKSLLYCLSGRPSALLIIFLIQTLSSRNLPQWTSVTQHLPRYPMSPIHHPDPGSLVNVGTLGAQSLTNQEVFLVVFGRYTIS